MPETTNFEWELPDVGGDEDTWSTILNTTLEEIDVALAAVKATADAAVTPAMLLIGTNVVTGSVSGSHALDLAVSRNYDISIGGNTTFSLTNVPSGIVVVNLKISQGASPFTVSWPAGIRWSSPSTAGESGTPGWTANKYNVLRLTTFDGGTIWTGEFLAAAHD